ncbi:hypothetical protein, partial [Bacillus cereus]|uniref:hypothetical protein n=1 Tax=Bacillus cereus TaxID=1396 RepID=UPI003A8E5340
YRFTAFILSFEENLAIKNAPPIVSYVSNNWGALHVLDCLFAMHICTRSVYFKPFNIFSYEHTYKTLKTI